MVVTLGSYRSGSWKLRFLQRGANPLDHKVSGAVLHGLSKDPAEEKDLSESHSEVKAQLFAEYQQFIANRKLKPLAEKFFERKSQKKGRSRKPRKKTPSARSDVGKKAKGRRTGAGVIRVPNDVELSVEQKARADAVVKEYGSRKAELQAKLESVLTNEQKQARTAAKKKALEEGKKGMALRKAVDAAAKLTEEQKKQLTSLRRAMAKLTREYREKLRDVLTDEQKAKEESLQTSGWATS